jgi:hypothetical protein
LAATACTQATVFFENRGLFSFAVAILTTTETATNITNNKQASRTQRSKGLDGYVFFVHLELSVDPKADQIDRQTEGKTETRTDSNGEIDRYSERDRNNDLKTFALQLHTHSISIERLNLLNWQHLPAFVFALCWCDLPRKWHFLNHMYNKLTTHRTMPNGHPPRTRGSPTL